MIFYSSLQPEGIDYIIPFFGCSILTHSRANEGNVRISVDICLRSSYIFQTGMFKIWKQCHWGFLNFLQRIWKLNLLSELAISEILPEILRANRNAVCALPSFSEFEVHCPHVFPMFSPSGWELIALNPWPPVWPPGQGLPTWLVEVVVSKGTPREAGELRKPVEKIWVVSSAM